IQRPRVHRPAARTGDAEPGADVTGERLVGNHDPGFDHHLVDRLVELLYQLADGRHPLRDVDHQQGVGTAIEAQAAARGQEAPAVARTTGATPLTGLALVGEQGGDVLGVAVADRDVLGDHLDPLFQLQAGLLTGLLVAGDLVLRRNPDDVAVAALVQLLGL